VGGEPCKRPAATAPLSPDGRRARAGSGARCAAERETARSFLAGTAGCVIAALFVLALALLAALYVVPAVVRGVGRERVHDPAWRLLAFAARGLPPDRGDWAQAMLVELEQVEGRSERWRFSLGCAWAAGRIRLHSPEPGGAGLRAVILACAGLSLALIGYGFVRYPGLRSEPNTLGAMLVFLAAVSTYAGLAVILARGVSRQAFAARRFGLCGGLATAAGWLLGISPPAALKGWVFLPFLVALVGPAATAIVAGRRSHDVRTGKLTALWSGLVAGLTVFVVWTIVTYADAGGPYDRGLLEDFRASGAHDLVTYAVGDDLGSGLVLLLMIPAIALALGTLGTRLLAGSQQS
jgi:hypothetical protein